jgi:hypothetical protein
MAVTQTDWLLVPDAPTVGGMIDHKARAALLRPGGRLLEAKRLANETINLRVPLQTVEEVDDEVVAWVDRAWETYS